MPHTLHCEARAYVQCRYTSWSYVTPVSANAAHFFAHGTIRLLYFQQTGFGYLSEWLLVGFLNNNTKWINVLVMGFVKTLFQFHRLFSVERYVVFNTWHSEWRHCHYSHIHGPILDAVSMSHRRASTDMVISEWWSGIIVEEHSIVLISGTLTEFALSLRRKTTKKFIITTISDETQAGLFPNESEALELETTRSAFMQLLILLLYY
jgi:hypothetical protein